MEQVRKSSQTGFKRRHQRQENNNLKISVKGFVAAVMSFLRGGTCYNGVYQLELHWKYSDCFKQKSGY